ncbi:protein LATERAL ROOT PRIMORDIUM 1-like [Prosopis cineraria]|uniref:protein LATERAL ROOT PRIMORDIUM 1-like n=1 Tax=Prosopis cineraria TaxID=364024 RepID=UPI00240FD3F1|nr:protein LATERAL ROOT PRIMORDIUM 1-like [Prosopis cineraria]XP_054811667.1 protein LATERAL ROOT PRIMORDIUM 1-like [Prosopis cineraria]
MSMLGLRDLLLIAPNSSLHHHQQQQPPPPQQDHSNLHPLPSSASLSVGLGIFPLLTTTPCVPNDLPHDSADHNHQNTAGNSNFWNLKMCPEVGNSAKKGMIDVDGEENGIFGGDFRVCQDCGNRAKKDCGYRRCRTCCKGRGYDCRTHIKSTWVPAARRRERQMTVPAAAGGGGGASGSPPGSKRPRAFGSLQNVATTSHSSASNATTPRSLDTSSRHQDVSFKHSLPGHVRAPAVFRCHRVSAIGNGEDELAYMATVHISGHVFKGFLYDQGAGGKITIPCVSELQLGNYSSEKNRECSSPIGVPTNNAYPASGC